MRLSAPGKLFLTGEYAVLWGAPAVLAAVAPRMTATVEPRADGTVELRVPGGTSRATRTAQGLRWTGPEAPARFARRALELAVAANPDAPGLTVRFEPGARGPRGQKLGLGSSASAAVIAAAAGLGGVPDADRVFAVAAQAHWEVQGQRGSNGDVAAAAHGGLIRYTRYPIERPAAQRPAAPDLAPLPDRALHLALAFSGRSAKTPSMVAAVEAALSAAERADFVRRSTELTEAFCAAQREGDAGASIAALNGAGDLLAELGQRAGVAVVTPKLTRIQEVGRAHGLAAKVSGAGGGDGALLCGFDRKALRAAMAELRRLGVQTLDVPLAPGVRVDRAGRRSAEG
jgi:phosphomevalonate kinase